MPFNFQVVNATYVNAYAFPGGSIAATRGILLTLDDEAELAALLGHEMGHVNARHTAEHMSKGMLTQAIVSGVSMAAGSVSPMYGEITSQLGMISAGALLATYSRDNEREADALGLAYMAESGYNPDGFVGLMDMLNNMSHRHVSSFDMLFATHPMSDERYRTAVSEVNSRYTAYKKNPLYRERYMDHTASLRKIKGAIVSMQRGAELMGQEKFPEAEGNLKSALRQAPNDYAGLLLMTQCQLVQNKYSEALRYVEDARQVYPTEAQAHYLAGYTHIQLKKYETAFNAFNQYERLLPGNPSTIFFLGLSSEGMKRQKDAANYYYNYLQQVNQGKMAQHAYNRLKQWGYIR
jgi:predicted Zn-dependent protease